MSSLSEDGRQPASAEVSGEGYLLEEMMQLRGPRMAGGAHCQEEKRARYERCIGCGVCSVDEVGTLEIFKMGKRNDGELKKDLWKGTGEWSVGGEVGMKWVAGTITKFIWIGCSKLFFLMYWLCLIIWNNRGKSWIEANKPMDRWKRCSHSSAAPRYSQNHYALRTCFHSSNWLFNESDLHTNKYNNGFKPQLPKIKNITHLFVVICCHGCSYVSVC